MSEEIEANVKNVIVIGYHEAACLEIDYLIKHGFNVCAVIPNIIRYNQNMFWYRNIKTVAEQNKIEIWEEKSLKNNKALLERIKLKGVGCIFSGFSSFIFPDELIESVPFGCFNFHNADLPNYRGRAAPIWAKINGEKKIAMTLHKIDSGIDTGPIISKKMISIELCDDMKRIYEKCNFAEALMLDEFLPKLKSLDYVTTPQTGNISSFSWNDKTDRYLDAKNMTVNQFIGKVNALRPPFPGALLTKFGKSFAVTECEILEVDGFQNKMEPGQIISVDNNDVILRLIDGIIKITEIEYKERFLLPAHFCHIVGIQQGDYFGD